jgi:hypothetical protein
MKRPGDELEYFLVERPDDPFAIMYLIAIGKILDEMALELGNETGIVGRDISFVIEERAQVVEIEAPCHSPHVVDDRRLRMHHNMLIQIYLDARAERRRIERLSGMVDKEVVCHGRHDDPDIHAPASGQAQDPEKPGIGYKIRRRQIYILLRAADLRYQGLIYGALAKARRIGEKVESLYEMMRLLDPEREASAGILPYRFEADLYIGSDRADEAHVRVAPCLHIFCDADASKVNDLAVDHKDLSMVAEKVRREVGDAPRADRIKKAHLDSLMAQHCGYRRMIEGVASHHIAEQPDLEACLSFLDQNVYELLSDSVIVEDVLFYVNRLFGLPKIGEHRLPCLSGLRIELKIYFWHFRTIPHMSLLTS